MTAALWPFLPQILLLVVGGLAVLDGGRLRIARVWGPVSFAAICCSVGLLWFVAAEPAQVDHAAGTARAPAVVSQGVTDTPVIWSRFGRTTGGFVLLLGGILSLTMCGHSERQDGTAISHGLLLLGTAGTMLVCVAPNLLLLFVGWELCGLSTVGLLTTTTNRDVPRTHLRIVFARHAVSTILLLFAAGLLFAMTSTTNLMEIRSAFASALKSLAEKSQTANDTPLAKIALVLLFAAVAIRAALAPFHFGWPQATCEAGWSTLSYAFTLPLIAAFAMLYRVGLLALPGMEPTVMVVSLVLSGASLLVGSVFALVQPDLRRTLACLAVGFAGAMLFGLTAASGQRQPALADFVEFTPLARGETAWLLTSLSVLMSFAGLFAYLHGIEPDARPIEYAEQLKGLFRRRPYVAVGLALLLLNLIGAPPLPGFWARLITVTAALSVPYESAQTGATFHPAYLCVLALYLLHVVLTAIISLRLIAVMVFDQPLGGFNEQAGKTRAMIAGALCTVIVVLCSIAPTTIVRWLTQLTDV